MPAGEVMLVIANEYVKHAEEANGVYRFSIPGEGWFQVKFDASPGDPS